MCNNNNPLPDDVREMIDDATGVDILAMLPAALPYICGKSGKVVIEWTLDGDVNKGTIEDQPGAKSVLSFFDADGVNYDTYDNPKGKLATYLVNYLILEPAKIPGPLTMMLIISMMKEVLGDKFKDLVEDAKKFAAKAKEAYEKSKEKDDDEE